MKVSEFAQQYPQCAIDFTRPIRDQVRIYDGVSLDQFPIELEPDFAYQVGGRGRPNPNQTLAHSQCATCHRVLRNDMFYTLPSMKKKNIVFSHCRACSTQLNAARYEVRAEVIRARRDAIWQYLAPRCRICGFDKHMSAMDIHHTRQKEAQIAELITDVTLTLDAGKLEALLREASKGIPICSNCHRMLHAGVIHLPAPHAKPSYEIAVLLTQLKAID